MVVFADALTVCSGPCCWHELGNPLLLMSVSQELASGHVVGHLHVHTGSLSLQGTDMDGESSAMVAVVEPEVSATDLARAWEKNPTVRRRAATYFIACKLHLRGYASPMAPTIAVPKHTHD